MNNCLQPLFIIQFSYTTALFAEKTGQAYQRCNDAPPCPILCLALLCHLHQRRHLVVKPRPQIGQARLKHFILFVRGNIFLGEVVLHDRMRATVLVRVKFIPRLSRDSWTVSEVMFQICYHCVLCFFRNGLVYRRRRVRALLAVACTTYDDRVLN